MRTLWLIMRGEIEGRALKRGMSSSVSKAGGINCLQAVEVSVREGCPQKEGV